MIKIENIEPMGWEPAIRGMRNPMNSWDKSDSEYKTMCSSLGPNEEPHWCNHCGYDACDPYLYDEKYVVGDNDLDLMKRLAAGGSTHAKYRRMITVYMDITAPLYWWKEYDTYKVGTVANSCSTMHKIHAKEFVLDDFSHDHLCDLSVADLNRTIETLNKCRQLFLDTKDKKYWWQMIQLLPSSYNQKRTVLLNYEVLSHMYHDRKDHKLDEWREFCQMIKSLPYAQIITMEVSDEDND